MLKLIRAWKERRAEAKRKRQELERFYTNVLKIKHAMEDEREIVLNDIEQQLRERNHA